VPTSWDPTRGRSAGASVNPLASADQLAETVNAGEEYGGACAGAAGSTARKHKKTDQLNDRWPHGRDFGRLDILSPTTGVVGSPRVEVTRIPVAQPSSDNLTGIFKPSGRHPTDAPTEFWPIVATQSWGARNTAPHLAFIRSQWGVIVAGNDRLGAGRGRDHLNALAARRGGRPDLSSTPTSDVLPPRHRHPPRRTSAAPATSSNYGAQRSAVPCSPGTSRARLLYLVTDSWL